MKRWTANELVRLKLLYAQYQIRQIAVILDRPRQSVARKCQELGLSPKKPRWTDAEKRKLLTEYGPKSIAQLAREMNRSTYALYNFAALHKWSRP